MSPTAPSAWEDALAALEADLDRAEQLVAEAGPHPVEVVLDERSRPATALPAHLAERAGAVLERTRALEVAVAGRLEEADRALRAGAARPRATSPRARQTSAYLDARA